MGIISLFVDFLGQYKVFVELCNFYTEVKSLLNPVVDLSSEFKYFKNTAPQFNFKELIIIIFKESFDFGVSFFVLFFFLNFKIGKMNCTITYSFIYIYVPQLIIKLFQTFQTVFFYGFIVCLFLFVNKVNNKKKI